MVPLSVLDLAHVVHGSTVAQALANTVDLAQHCERFGYRRFWLAEHHNMAGIASAATSVVIGHVAHHTKTIRVGAGGIMLPNHSPLVIAEQFGTLETLFPDRIDLGLGRAPGTDQQTLYALRRTPSTAENFPQDVVELQALLGPQEPGQKIRAIPGVGTNVPLWILGSSLFGAQLAAALGLPFAFASHFAPAQLLRALDVYRQLFRASSTLEKPHVMVACNVICAETDAEARRLFTSLQQVFTNMMRGTRGKLSPPIDDIETYWAGPEKAQAQSMLERSYVGSPQTVRDGLDALVGETEADELIVASAIYDHAARVRSYELLADAVL